MCTIVTGGASGIGRGSAIKLGAEVVIRIRAATPDEQAFIAEMQYQALFTPPGTITYAIDGAARRHRCKTGAWT